MSTTDSDVEDRPNPEPSQPPLKRSKDVSPQQSIDKFWRRFTTKHPGKPFTTLPDNLYAKRAAIQAARQPAASKNAVASYEQAAATCKAKVDKIVHACRRLNQKYKDPHFDIEFDYLQWQWYGRVEDCLAPLDADETELRPLSVKRVEDIFDEPQFYIEGMTASDVRQGRDGDCWFMSSICTLTNKEDLLERVCVARDEKVGVYGFVFHRDGEWISEVIDDKLYLAKEDFHESLWEQFSWLTIDMPNADDEYRKVMQTGSKSLHFAQCKDQNETWLPLLEKAYAKAHGDYGVIEGGWVGEGLEDLTGGVTSELFAADILDKDKFWTDELMNVNKLFLFGLAQMGGLFGERRGIIEKHAYSIMEAKELDNFRLLKIRNPWGKHEWDGPWSDGSEEWTPDRMRRLGHIFGNDGVFWISYKDLLKHFQHIDRTRLFGADWSITQHWTNVNVPWTVNYLDTHFKISMPRASHVVIVLSQLDDRYFRGLTGQYDFELQFRLHKDGEDDYIARNNPSYFMTRSVTTELELEAGQYSVMIKVSATRAKSKPTPEQIIKKTCHTRRDKLMAVGLSYDLAHAKGRFKEIESERKKRLQVERRERRRRQAEKAFGAQRKANKREKLKRLRLEAKEKAKKGSEAENKDETSTEDKGAEIVIKIGESGLKFGKAQDIDEHGRSKALEGHAAQGETSKSLKVVVEAYDKMGGLQRGTQAVNEATEPFKKNENALIEEGSPASGEAEAADKDDKGVEKTTNTGVVLPATSESRNRQEGLASLPGLQPDTSAKSGSNAEEKKADDPSVMHYTPADSDVHAGIRTDANKTKKFDPEMLPPKLLLDEISDDGLSWASDVDVPSSSSSEAEPDSDEEDPVSEPSVSSPSSEKQADDISPWNAVCVIGLRLYSKGSQAEIEVVRQQDDGGSTGNKKLDVDDRAADATKKLQKGSPQEERQLNTVDTAPVGEEESKQG